MLNGWVACLVTVVSKCKMSGNYVNNYVYFWECWSYRGGSAKILADLPLKVVYLGHLLINEFLEQ